MAVAMNAAMADEEMAHDNVGVVNNAGDENLDDLPLYEFNQSIDILNDDCLALVLSYLPLKDKLKLETVSKRWQRSMFKFHNELKISINSNGLAEESMPIGCNIRKIEWFCTLLGDKCRNIDTLALDFEYYPYKVGTSYYEFLLEAEKYKAEEVSQDHEGGHQEVDDYQRMQRMRKTLYRNPVNMLNRVAKSCPNMVELKLSSDHGSLGLDLFTEKYGEQIRILRLNKFPAMEQQVQFSTIHFLYNFRNLQEIHIKSMPIVDSDEFLPRLKRIYCERVLNKDIPALIKNERYFNLFVTLNVKNEQILRHIPIDKTREMLDLVKKMGNLKSLTVVIEQLKNEHMAWLPQSLELIATNCTQLETLSLTGTASGCGFDKEKIEVDLLKSFQHFSSLRRVTIALNDFSVFSRIDGTLEWFKNNEKLWMLDLTLPRVSEDFLTNIGTYLPNLTQFKLDAQGISEKFIFDLPKLKKLVLNGYYTMDVLDMDIFNMIKNCTNLEEVHLINFPRLEKQNFETKIKSVLNSCVNITFKLEDNNNLSKDERENGIQNAQEAATAQVEALHQAMQVEGNGAHGLPQPYHFPPNPNLQQQIHNFMDMEFEPPGHDLMALHHHHHHHHHGHHGFNANMDFEAMQQHFMQLVGHEDEDDDASDSSEEADMFEDFVEI